MFAVLSALAGCSAIQQKVEMDASAAAMIAANAGDTAGAACFKALEPVVETAPGLLSKLLRPLPHGSHRRASRLAGCGKILNYRHSGARAMPANPESMNTNS